MFEVGKSRTTRLQAQQAPLQRPSLDPHHPRKHASLWRRKRVRLLLAALVAGLGLGAIEEAARHYGYAHEVERLARATGFGIDQVTLVGHRFSYDRDIFDAIDLGNVRTFAALDTQAVKSRIERLPWIDTAELTRVIPGRLEIRVTERKPSAVWSRAGSLYLIDKTGRVLASVSGDTVPDLPRFAGEGAAALATELTETLARYPEIASRLAEAERVSERRWRLKLNNQTALELPADGEVGVLEEITRDSDLTRRIVAGNATLDFRGPGRVAIRSTEAEQSASPAPSPSPGT